MKQYYFLISIFFIGLYAFAQDGSLDTSFGDNGLVQTDFVGGMDLAQDVVVQSNGKIIAVGAAELNNKFSFAIARYLADGSLDTSFNGNGKILVESDNSFDLLTAVEVRENGNIIVGGLLDGFFEGANDFIVMQYLPDGSLDPNFGNNGSSQLNIGTDFLEKIILRSDGTLLVVGNSRVNNDNYDVVVLKLLENGALDTSFANNGISRTTVDNTTLGRMDAKLQNNKLLVSFVGGRSGGGIDELSLLRFSNNGSLDNSFGTNGLSKITVLDAVFYNLRFDVDEDLNYILAFNENAGLGLSKVLNNGELDTTFGTDGFVFLGSDFLRVRPNGVLIFDDSKIIVGATEEFIESGEFRICKFNSDGTLDANFGNNGYTQSEFEGTNFSLDYDGNIVGVGSSNTGGKDFVVARYINTSPLSIEENPLQTLTIYPNPSTGIFNIKTENLTEATFFQITDISGKIIQTGILETTETTIDLSNTANGLYFLNAGGTLVKLVKQ